MAYRIGRSNCVSEDDFMKKLAVRLVVLWRIELFQVVFVTRIVACEED